MLSGKVQAQTFSWLMNWINNVCLFEIRYEFYNVWKNMLGSDIFSVFNQLWFILLGHMVYFLSCLLGPAATWSVLEGWSQLSLHQMFRKDSD